MRVVKLTFAVAETCVVRRFPLPCPSMGQTLGRRLLGQAAFPTMPALRVTRPIATYRELVRLGAPIRTSSALLLIRETTMTMQRADLAVRAPVACAGALMTGT